MSEISTIVLLPFIAAFLIFVLRFYSREGASSMLNFSFVMGVATVVSAGAYLLLRISDTLPTYGTIGFGVIGCAFLATAITRMFML